MNKSIGIIFTLGYILVISFIVGMANSLVGISSLMIPFAIGFLVVAIIALWFIYLFKFSSTVFFCSGLGIGLLLIGTFLASGRSINKLDDPPIAKVYNMKDEILFSKMGNPIGIRLNYQMRFPDNKLVTMYPEKHFHVDIWAGMHIANQNSEPPMIATNPPKHERGKFYNFTIDMIPNFLIPNIDKTKPLCIAKMPKEYADAFQKLLQNNEAMHFSIEVWDTKYREVTANNYSLKEFYDGAIKEGLLECKGRIVYR